MKLVNAGGWFINLDAVSYAAVKNYKSGAAPNVVEEIAEVHFIGGGDPLSITGAGVDQIKAELEALSGTQPTANAAQTVANKVLSHLNIGSVKP